MAKVRRAQETSDLATDAETEMPPKRKARPNPRYQQDSSSDEDVTERVFNSTPSQSSSHQSVSTKTPVTSSSPIRLPSPPTTLLRSGTPPVKSVIRPIGCTATEKKIMTLIEEQKMIAAENRAILVQILRRLESNTQQESESGGLPEGVKFPLNLVKDVRDLEALLHNFEKEKRLVTYLSTIGGDNLANTVRRILSCTMTNDLARQFNWIGKGTKEAFSKLRLVNVIQRSVRRNSGMRSATNSEIDSVIKDWLKYAKDRDGGRARRAAVRQAAIASVSQESTEDYGSSEEN
ncbi:uncharacterized protein [Asterias amurensis]